MFSILKRTKQSIKDTATIGKLILCILVLTAFLIYFVKEAPEKFGIETIECLVMTAITMLVSIPLGWRMCSHYTKLNIATPNDSLEKRLRDLNEEYEAKVRENASLCTAKTKLEQEIDTMRQTQQFAPTFTSSRQLQVLTISKSGHLVKEEDLFPLKNTDKFAENFPKYQRRIGLRDLEQEDNYKVYLSQNKVYRYGVGVKFEDIKCAYDSRHNILYLKNLKLSRLVRHENDFGHYRPEDDSTNHVWIVKQHNNGNYEIINDNQHQQFKHKYKNSQIDMAGKAIQDAIDNLCEFYTEGLCKLLQTRYGEKIYFINDETFDANLEWVSLSEGLIRYRFIISTFMNDLYLAFDTMELCCDTNKEIDNYIKGPQTLIS